MRVKAFLNKGRLRGENNLSKTLSNAAAGYFNSLFKGFEPTTQILKKVPK